MNAFIQGFLFSLSLSLDLGLVNTAVVRTGLERGMRQAFWIGFGSCVGDLVYLTLALAGFSAVVRIDVVRRLLWAVGTAALLYLAYRMIRETLAPRTLDVSERSSGPTRSAWKNVLLGVGLALSSPTAVLWFAATAGAIVAEANAADRWGIAAFVAGFFAAGVLWAAALATVSGKTGRQIGSGWVRVMSAASAALFLYFAVRIAAGGVREWLGN